MLDKRGFFDDVRKEGENRSKRHKELKIEISNWKKRLDLAVSRIQEIEERNSICELEIKEAKNIPHYLSDKKEKLIKGIAALELKKATSSENLSLKEAELRKAKESEKISDKLVGELREETARLDAYDESARSDVESTRKMINTEFGKEPNDLIASLKLPLEGSVSSMNIEDDIQRCRRQRESLGAVNLRAEEDSVDIAEEFKNLFKEKEDLSEATKKLRSGIIKLNNEPTPRLLEAFESVNKNFSNLFTHLFGGGNAKLTLIESDDPLDAGLEIMCQPPGKKLSSLSLLSGGEQTLTALSLIFAVFLVKPSPICVLDEVDAPLDDANVERFCSLLDEMSVKTNTRFLIITHHALTMSRMDRLYGVTMVERGVSQIVSVDLKKAEELIEA
jgi:chromosome segregation protein